MRFLTLNSKEGYIDNPEQAALDQPDKKRDQKAVEPNQTLYINNLNEKIKKDGKWWLHLFYSIFSENSSCLMI